MKTFAAMLLLVVPALASADQPVSTFRCQPTSTFAKRDCSCFPNCNCGPDCKCADGVGCKGRRSSGGSASDAAMEMVNFVGVDQPTSTFVTVQPTPSPLTTTPETTDKKAKAANHKCPICGAELTDKQIAELKGTTEAPVQVAQPVTYYYAQPTMSYGGGGGCAGGNCGTGRVGLFGRRR